ncbi:hypothetical protein AHF37_05452 [Paragonimus kellicotti]|nr:hypothetical protein AHF37_05452 [Paragonimus kellicotti]
MALCFLSHLSDLLTFRLSARTRGFSRLLPGAEHHQLGSCSEPVGTPWVGIGYGGPFLLSHSHQHGQFGREFCQSGVASVGSCTRAPAISILPNAAPQDPCLSSRRLRHLTRIHLVHSSQRYVHSAKPLGRS